MDIASSAIGLLNFAIECFNNIQLAREFEQEFSTYQLKLDVLQVRLSRWGEVLRSTNPSNSGSQAGDSRTARKKEPDDDADPATKAHRILSEIQDTILSAQRHARRIETRLGVADKKLLDPEVYVPADLKKIRIRFRECVRRWKAKAGKVVEATKWAFYQRASFEKFVTDMSALVSDLENLFPEDARQKLSDLSKEECDGISKSNLEELKDIVEECDPWLGTAVDEMLQSRLSAGTNITQSHNTGMVTGIHRGDVNGVSNGNGNKTRNYWGRT
ncbi:prion-inhibition and propagation-domain-containing protein [Daldinia vernicosa]|uniref:prion-inhibition and propagation-domain-containing protein n=1 Tax=Daldinia vernicosa TaxID=114800 RepID=UPI0020086010|nr:prion-inhibition and propagation-domain-containing protein [Daldinia vernicosa]KAI0847665.1 prion-inhibition and propagation-domain-containing protein [Daldinia vernicosa]